MDLQFRRKLGQLLHIHTYIDPIFFYLPVIYGLSKLHQWSVGDAESVWEKLWIFSQELVGKMFKF